MTAQSVCAVVVTYHPAAGAIEHIAKVLAQVEGLVVVDNGSNADAINLLRTTSHDFGFQLIENEANLGIAEALNQGVRWAASEGYPWVILFDQDSTITEGFMGHMFAAWQSHPLRERVSSIHPRYVDPKTGIEAAVPRASDGSPVFPMTSGSLMPTWIFNKIGWFASEYFIDLVDWEYCFRIRAAGYLVADARQATLLHAPGDPAKTTVLGHTFHTTYHSAMRRYYISRNSVIFYRQYFRLFPAWILKALYRHLTETAICFIVGGNRTRKLRSFLVGTWDGLNGRMGGRESP